MNMLEENISRWIQHPDRGEAAATPCSVVQLVVRLKMYPQQGRAHKASPAHQFGLRQSSHTHTCRSRSDPRSESSFCTRVRTE